MSNVGADKNKEWIEAMRRGDFTAAWNISYAVLLNRRDEDQWKLQRWQQSIWNGNAVEGKRVLVRCYHGLGDTIQFIRYAALLKKIAAEVILWVQPSLIPLLRSVEGIDRMLPLHDGSPEVDYDVDLELAELPYVFRTTIESIPPAPYLFVEPAVLARDELRRVGLIWKSGDWDERRSIPF